MVAMLAALLAAQLELNGNMLFHSFGSHSFGGGAFYAPAVKTVAPSLGLELRPRIGVQVAREAGKDLFPVLHGGIQTAVPVWRALHAGPHGGVAYPLSQRTVIRRLAPVVGVEFSWHREAGDVFEGVPVLAKFLERLFLRYDLVFVSPRLHEISLGFSLLLDAE